MFEGHGGIRTAVNERRHRSSSGFAAVLDVFENVFGQLFQTERLEADLATPTTTAARTSTTAFLRYLRRCVNGEDHPFALPEIPCYLNELLACEDFYGGIEPRIGRKHIRVIAIDGFPKMSSPGILRELDTPAHRIPLEHARHPD